MNPPSVLHSTMGNQKKPFSYLPGGLDISQIKSEKMARRLMRNAMNPGVQEKPSQNLPSPPTPNTPILNYSNLPVQVFPSIQLPANPKTLLRTRSTPYQTNLDKNKGSNQVVNSTPHYVYAVQPSGAEQLRESSLTQMLPLPKNNLEHPFTQYSTNANSDPYTNLNDLNQNVMANDNHYYESNGHYNAGFRFSPTNEHGSHDSADKSSTMSSYEVQPSCLSVITPVSPPVAINVIKCDQSELKYVPPPFKDDSPINELKENNFDLKCDSKPETLNSPDNNYGDSDSGITVVRPILPSEILSRMSKTPSPNKLKHSIQNADTIYDQDTLKGDDCVSKETEQPCEYVKDEYTVRQEKIFSCHENDNNEKIENLIRAETTKGVTMNAAEKHQESANEEDDNAESTVTVKLTAPQKSVKTTVETVTKVDSDGRVEETKTTETKTMLNGKVENKKVIEKKITDQVEIEEDIIEEEDENEEIEEEEVDEEEVEEEEEAEEVEESVINPTKQVVKSVKIIEPDAKESNLLINNVSNEVTQEKKVTISIEEQESNELGPEEEYEEVEEEEIEVEEVEQGDELEEQFATPEPSIQEQAHKESTESDHETVHQSSDNNNNLDQAKSVTKQEIEHKIEIHMEERKEVEEEHKHEIPLEEKKELNHQDVKNVLQEGMSLTEKEPSGIKNNQENPEPINVKVEKSETKTETSVTGSVPEVITTTLKETSELTSSCVPNIEGKPVSTQTELHRIENIVTVNKTTSKLENAYELLTQQGIPTLKSYFSPNKDTLLETTDLSKSYEPKYMENNTEKRHSLLLERLSVERQIPAIESSAYRSVFQPSSQINSEQRNEQLNLTSSTQTSNSEIVNTSNVKPSSIKSSNQQWFQKQTDEENVLYNNVQNQERLFPLKQGFTPASKQLYSPPTLPHDQNPFSEFNQSYKPTGQSQYSYTTAQQTFSPNQETCVSKNPLFETEHSTFVNEQYTAPLQQQHYDPNQIAHSLYSPSMQGSQPYESTSSPYFSQKTDNRSYSQSDYQSRKTFNDPYSKSDIPTYTTLPSSWESNKELSRESASDAKQNLYSYGTNESCVSQKFTSSYVPPPWEQDPNLVIPETQYLSSTFKPSTFPTNIAPKKSNQSWKTSRQSKPNSYVPPAPNQSFVKVNTTPAEAPKVSGKNTYYSEYERRYVTVPENAYVPADTCLQPDPSPQYYYDQPDIKEEVEPSWRKELREFTEKSTLKTETIESSIKPNWQNYIDYGQKDVETKLNPTPTWSQTLRPRSWRERSFEPESIYQNEFPKTSTLDRKQVSSFTRNEHRSTTERTRGVSVDRYNPQNYQSPGFSSGTNNYSFSWETDGQYNNSLLSPTFQNTATQPMQSPQPPISPQAKQYCKPTVPASHRAPTEPRELDRQHRQKSWGQPRHFPVQSRSFKYLQMLTGTEDGVEQPEPFVQQPPLQSVPRPRKI